MNAAVNRELDIRGMMMPFGLLKVTLAFKGLAEGQVLRIKLEDRSTVDDILNVLKRFAHRVLYVRHIEDYFILSLEKLPGSEN